MKSKKASSAAGECRERGQPLDIKALKKESRERAASAEQSFPFNHPCRRDTIRCASTDETPGLSLTILNFRRRCYQFTDRTGRVSTLRSAYTRGPISVREKMFLVSIAIVAFGKMHGIAI